MALERRWVVRCDEPACAEVLVIPPPDDGGPDDRWGAGECSSDAGWDLQPRRRESYCPRHARFENLQSL